MLSITRKISEKVVLFTEQGDITIMIQNVKGNQVRLSVDAPDEVKVLRSELITNNQTLPLG